MAILQSVKETPTSNKCTKLNLCQVNCKDQFILNVPSQFKGTLTR